MREKPSLDPRKHGGPSEGGHHVDHYDVGRGSSVDQTTRNTSNHEGNMKSDSTKIHRDDRNIG